MDAAKIIAAGALGTLKVPQMKGAFKFKTKPLPLFLVPTTAGTGAETTVGAVVSSKSEDNKYAVIDTKLLPLVIALDHQLMLGIPPKITAETGIDALTHAVESYIGTRATEKTKRASITAIKLVFNYLERAYNNGQDIEAREAMAFAAYQGGVALEASAGYVHAIAHQLGARYHLTHGHCNAVIMPHVLEYSLSKASKPLAELANVIGVSSTQKTERENAQLFIDAIKDLNNKLGITQILPGIKTEEIPQLFKKAQEEAMSIYGVVRYMTQSDGEALIHKLIPTA